MNDYNTSERKPELDLAILRAQLEALHKQIDSRPDFLGVKTSLNALSAEMENTSLNQERMREMQAELALYERLLRERLEREAREQKAPDSKLEKLGKALSGELEI